MRRQAGAIVLMLSVLLLVACDEDKDDTTTTPGGGRAESGSITGRVTTADGKPITTAGVSCNLAISGVSDAGEKVGFSPGVKPDGTFKQKVPPGSYRMQTGKITVAYNGTEFTFDLEPQGDQYKSDRDGKEGFTQDFVWRVTGPKLFYKNDKPDPSNATHWNGMNIAVRAAGYRNDIGKVAAPPPDGTIFTFTLKPAGNGKAIDGSDLKPLTFERAWNSKTYPYMTDLNDFLPGDYELTASAKLPDGTTKPVLLQGRGNYPNYVSVVKATLEKDALLGGMWKQSVDWVVE